MTRPDNNIRVTISLPARLCQLFDSVIAERRYSTRSEAIRDLIRPYVESYLSKFDNDGTVKLGTVSYILPNKRQRMSEIIECETEFWDIVNSVSVVCYNSIVMRVAMVCGNIRRIHEFKDAIEAVKDVVVVGTAGWRIEEV